MNPISAQVSLSPLRQAHLSPRVPRCSKRFAAVDSR